MTKDEALRLALEALESTGENDGYHGIDQYFDNVLVDKAITALRLAIDVENITSKATYKEQLETKNEPVAWGMGKDGVILDVICPAEHEREEGEYTIPLYTHPKEWVWLTDKEVDECLQGLPTQTIDVYARRIEIKIKDKNT